MDRLLIEPVNWACRQSRAKMALSSPPSSLRKNTNENTICICACCRRSKGRYYANMSIDTVRGGGVRGRRRGAKRPSRDGSSVDKTKQNKKKVKLDLSTRCSSYVPAPTRIDVVLPSLATPASLYDTGSTPSPHSFVGYRVASPSFNTKI